MIALPEIGPERAIYFITDHIRIIYADFCIASK